MNVEADSERYLRGQLADLQSQLADAAQRERELIAERDEARSGADEAWAWVEDLCTAVGEKTTVFTFKDDIAFQQHTICGLRAKAAEVDEATRRLREAATEFMATAAELRREISPDKGCGYLTYSKVWDANFAAEVKLKAAINPEGSDVVPT